MHLNSQSSVYSGIGLISSGEKLLDVIVEQSYQLQRLILAGELLEAERLEHERRQTIERCFAEIATFEEPQKAIECIQKVIALDARSISDGTQLSIELKKDLARLHKGHQAVRAYHKVDS